MDRCPICGFVLAGHFRPDGQLIGCPKRILLSDTGDHDLPRLIIRIGNTGDLRRHVLAVFADCRLDVGTPDESILVWDLDTGQQFWKTTRLVMKGTATKRADRDTRCKAQEQIEYELGHKVRVVLSPQRGGQKPTAGEGADDGGSNE